MEDDLDMFNTSLSTLEALEAITEAAGYRNCSCEQSKFSDEIYQLFFTVLILFTLPVVAICGIFCNFLSILVYTRYPLRNWSVNHYLAALAFADMSVDMCGLFVICADGYRGIIPALDWAYVRLLPFLFPGLMVAQTLSVYLTVAAAFDCFFSVCTTHYCRERMCRTRVADWVIFCIFVGAIAYNIVGFLELERVACYDFFKEIHKFEVCPTDLRMDDTYISVYKGYLYMILMAVFPFVLLAVLNLWIVSTVYRLKKAAELQPGDDAPASDSTTMLVMVVLLFLGCNAASLLVAVLEMAMGDAWYDFDPRHYLIDTGNFLVAFNSSANFFIYIIFSHTFRRTLRNLIKRKPRDPSHSTMMTTRWDADHVMLVNGAGDSATPSSACVMPDGTQSHRGSFSHYSELTVNSLRSFPASNDPSLNKPPRKYSNHLDVQSPLIKAVKAPVKSKDESTSSIILERLGSRDEEIVAAIESPL